MDTGLLLLRVAVALLLVFGHATQKLFAWPEGPGLDQAGKLFETWGHRPGKAMAAFAAISELVGGLLLAVGLFTPVGSAVVVATMIVAAAATAPNGLWNLRGGSELALLYGVIAASLAFTGPGKYSLDHAFGFSAAGNGWGLAMAATSAAASGLVIARQRVLLHAAHGAEQ
ncbi:DoxX family protein [Mycobacterium sp. 663a-19]|uniref:DoxX family protein n=1 Tax=Mycobacterium sp. 663a-19 TaxID=2986148 RepID=UPI002D1E6FC3|nr:DoxX family protein [Mycobacterium sp. 663a-19]MEB3980052.1 DoxX family protein [Mycobacterium sp. 663a-19]